MEIVKLSEVIGIEVRGLNISKPINDVVGSTLRQEWAKNSVLLIRGQELTEDAQFAYARIYGKVAARVKPPVEKRAYRADPDNPMQLVTDNLD